MKILGGFVSLCLILFLLVSMQLHLESQANLAQESELEVITADNASRLKELQIIGHGSLATATFSPDGRTLAIGTTAGVWFYEFENLEREPKYWNPGIGFTVYLQFDITGSYLQTATSLPDVGSFELYLWHFNEDYTQAELIDGKLIANGQYIFLADGSLLNPQTDEILSLDFPQDIDFVPNTNQIAAVSQDKLLALMELEADLGIRSREIRFFDLDGGQYIARIEIDEALTGGFSSIAFSADGEWLVASYTQYNPVIESTVRAWKLADLLASGSSLFSDGEILWRSSDRSISSLATNGSELWLRTQISEPYTLTTEVIRIPDGELIGQFNSRFVLSHPLTNQIFSLETVETYEWVLVNQSENRTVATLDDFGSNIYQAEFNHDASELLTISQEVDPNWIDVLVRLRTTHDWQTLSTLHLSNQIDLQARFQSDGRPIVVSLSGSSQESLKVLSIWDIRSQSLLYIKVIENASRISVSEDGRFLFIDAGIQRYLYDISQADSPQELTLPDYELASIRFTFGTFTPDGSYLILGEYGNNEFLTRFWDIQNQDEVSRIQNRQIVTNRFADSVSWIDNNRIMILCEPDQMTFWWFQDILETSYAVPFQAMTDGVLCRLGNQENYVAIPTYGAGIQTRFLTTDIGDTYGLDAGQWWRLAEFSPDGSLLFGFSYLGQMKVWRFHEQEALFTVNASPWQIENVQFIHNGTVLVLEAEDGTLRLWGVPATSN